MEKRIERCVMRAGDIKTGFGNPRKIIRNKLDELEQSFEMFGDFGIYLIDEHDNIIAGNQRLKVVLRKFGPDVELDCKRLIGYTEAELRAINIKDNTHAGEWDLDLLADCTTGGMAVNARFITKAQNGIAVIELYNQIGGAGSGLSTAADVDLFTPPTNGQTLKYDSTSGKWKPGT